MKIEKISDKQIRCNLSREDLAERHIQISELAYGSDKARALFRDMMMQAYKQYGFTNDANTPLMIEAIPDMENSLTIVITKVDDPEELDTRFAKFSPTAERADSAPDIHVDGADDILDLFKKLYETAHAAASGRNSKSGGSKNEKSDEVSGSGKPGPKTPDKDREMKTGTAKEGGRTGRKHIPSRADMPDLIRAYRFNDIEKVIAAARALGSFYKGKSALYHIASGKYYVLVLKQSGQTPERFNKVCNILSEYGAGEQMTAAKEAHLREHETVVEANHAVEKLISLS